MAKESKEFMARMDGMSYALRIAKEKGIEELEKDLKMRNFMKASTNYSKDEIKHFWNFISENCYNNMLTAVAVSLHECFGFGKDRLRKFKGYFDKIVCDTQNLDYMGEHYVKLEDFAIEDLSQKDLTYLSNARSISLLKQANTNLDNAIQCINNNNPIDIVELELDDEIKKIKTEIDKLEANKDKLFDLYVDAAITKDDFKERNGKIQQKIDTLKIEISKLNEKANNLGQTIKQLNGIKTYFLTSVSDCDSISENLVYELCKNLIEKIAIEPIDKNTANIIFVPKFGNKEEYCLLKDKSRVTIGYMSKKMIESYEMSNQNQ